MCLFLLIDNQCTLELLIQLRWMFFIILQFLSHMFTSSQLVHLLFLLKPWQQPSWTSRVFCCNTIPACFLFLYYCVQHIPVKLPCNGVWDSGDLVLKGLEQRSEKVTGSSHTNTRAVISSHTTTKSSLLGTQLLKNHVQFKLYEPEVA